METLESKTIKIVTDSSSLIVKNIVEYVCGFQRFYIYLKDGTTQSFARSHIKDIFRQLPTEEFKRIHLKKPRIKSVEDGNKKSY